MYHNKSNCAKLEGQLLGFPRSKLWDVMDATAYITFIMEKHAVYFDPIDGDGEGEMPEDEFESLSDDPMMGPAEMGFLL